MKHPTKLNHVAIRDVVLIRSEDRNRNNWPMGIVEKLFEGKDGVVRAVRLKSGRDRLERAIQHLYPLELSCDGVAANGQDGDNLNSMWKQGHLFQKERRPWTRLDRLRKPWKMNIQSKFA
jgi:hypothetical protein